MDARSLLAGEGGAEAAGFTHVAQFYESDAFLVDQIARFFRVGLEAGNGIVAVATRSHVEALEAKLGELGVDVAAARERKQYVSLDAAETVEPLLVDGLPDRTRFAELVDSIVSATAAAGFPYVRVFGEMVAVLWADGNRDGALRLEEMWSEVAETKPLSILCGYPVHAFEGDEGAPRLVAVCSHHACSIPAEGYTSLVSVGDRLRQIAELQQKARSLDHERLERLRLAAIVESSDDAIIGKTLEGVVTSWNQGAERIFGYTAAEMIGQSITRIIPSDCAEDLERLLGAIRRGERVDHFETQRSCKDGRRIHVSLSISPINDSAGRIVGASKIARDITQRREVEEELRRNRAAVDTLYGVGLALSAELDLDKLRQAVIDAATRLTGAKFGAFFYNATDDEGGHRLLYTLSGASREAFDRLGMPRNTALFAPAFGGTGVLRLDDVTKDPRYGQNAPHHGMPPGHLPVKSYLAVPVVGRGGVVSGALFLGHPEPGVFTETSERIACGLASHSAVGIENARLYEAERRLRLEAEAASRTKDEFLAMLGHELRNPLSAVRNAIVAASLDGSYRERALGIARRGADQLARLVDDLLDVARITQGKIALHRERVRLASVLERAVDTTRPLVDERGHDVEVRITSDPVDVYGDQTRLEQVVVNLITNAAKYTSPGGRIDVSLECEGSEAVLRVRDNGMGISPEMLPRVFDVFMQGERELDRGAGGLGIGLTVVRRIVELHAGHVEAHSDGRGRGAEFVVRLPLLAAPSAETRVSTGTALTVRRGARVLLVEDNPDAAESMALLLELLGHRVQVIHDGTAAIEIARVQRPEVMLVDIGLPGIDGYEVARRVRADPALSGVLLVALTGYGRAEDKQRALEKGFDHHLTKPVDSDALLAVVSSLPREPPSRRDESTLH